MQHNKTNENNTKQSKAKQNKRNTSIKTCAQQTTNSSNNNKNLNNNNNLNNLQQQSKFLLPRPTMHEHFTMWINFGLPFFKCLYFCYYYYYYNFLLPMLFHFPIFCCIFLHSFPLRVFYVWLFVVVAAADAFSWPIKQP